MEDDSQETPVQREKKQRTPAQIASWEKAQATRIANAKAKKERKTTEYVEKKIETLKKKLPERKPPVIQEVHSETDEEEETRITVVRVPSKPKPKPPKKKKEIVVQLEEEEFDEEEPITKPKVQPKARVAPAPIQKQSPVAPQLYFV